MSKSVFDTLLGTVRNFPDPKAESFEQPCWGSFLMKHIVKHGLESQLARRAAECALNAYCARFAPYNPSVTWEAHRANIRFKVKGISLVGALELGEDEFVLTLDVPLVFRLFRNQAIGVIEKEIGTWIDKAKRGEL